MPSSPVNYDDEKSFKVPELDVKFVPIPKTQLKSFQRIFPGPTYKDGLVKSDPGGFVITTRYAENADKILRIEPRKTDDVWLMTSPKTGIEILALYCTSYDQVDN